MKGKLRMVPLMPVSEASQRESKLNTRRDHLPALSRALIYRVVASLFFYFSFLLFESV